MPQVLLPPSLQPVQLSNHTFQYPEKRIHSQTDIEHFLTSTAYNRICAFLHHLNASVSPFALSQLQLQSEDSEFAVPTITPDKVFTKSVKIVISSPVQQIIGLIHSLEEIITECPPDTGPRRFGNVAFKSWHKLVEERVPESIYPQK